MSCAARSANQSRAAGLASESRLATLAGSPPCRIRLTGTSSFLLESVPDAIHQIDEVPRTLSNKKLEVPVKRILQGGDPGKVASRDSLANPAALDWFVERAGELTRAR